MATKKKTKCAVKPVHKVKETKLSKSITKKKAPKACVQHGSKKQTKKTVASKGTAPAKQNKAFAGASEVSITENKIILTREVSENRRGRYQRSEVREYLDKTPSNMAALNRKLQGTTAKKVTVKFKR